MTEISLTRTIDVQCWNVIGMVARACKRPELIPVLLRARERGRTSAEDVAEHLFFEQRSRRVVAQRLLHIAALYGLVTETDRLFSLTEAGLATLGSEQVFVPEHGSWTIWASDDPLLDHPVLRVDPWDEPTAREDLLGRDKESIARDFVNVPPTLIRSVGRVATPPGGNGVVLRVDELADRCEVRAPDAALRLAWSVGEGTMRLQGTLRGAPLDTVLDPPSMHPEDVWRHLLEAEGLWPSWDPTANALLVDFDKTEDRERERLLRDLEFAAPTLPDFGQFDAVTIRDVPLQARNSSDARQWAEWRLRARLQAFATTERFERWRAEAAAPFAAHQLPSPSRASLASEAWAHRGDRPPASAWHLIAAEDWSL